MSQYALVVAVTCCAAGSLTVVSSGCMFDLPPLAGAGGTHQGGGMTGGGAVGAGGGSTACDERWADCNGSSADGCETDTWSDSEHCGSCGHDCLDGSCVQGKCQPVVLLADNQMCAIALDNEWVYTFDGDTRAIQRTPKAGGTPMLLATLTGVVSFGFAVDGTHVYFTHSQEDEILRVESDGGAVEVVTTTSGSSRRLALDATHVYWFNDIQEPRPIQRALKEVGATAETLVADSDMVTSSDIAVDSGWLYWSSGTTLRRIPSHGGTPNTVANEVGVQEQLAVDDSHIYFCDFPNRNVGMVPKDGSSGVSVLASTAPLVASSLSVDDTHVYWITSAAVYKLPKTGAAQPTTLVEGFTLGCALAVDPTGDHVYFIADGQLARVAK